MPISRRVPRISPSTPDLFVGREREQAILHDAFDAMLAGCGSLMLVNGTSGIGKTSLVTRLADAAREARALVLWGHAYDLSLTRPYGPWIELAHTYRPRAGLPAVPAFLDDPETLAEVGNRETLFARALEFFSHLADKQPTVLLLEDLHWSDQASLELLRFLARHIAGQSLLVLCTYRSDEVSNDHPLYQVLPLLVREAHAQRLDLHGLDGEAVRDLVSTCYALAIADEDRLAGYLREHAEGNALYIHELLRTLEEEAILHRSGSSWCLGDLTQVPVPPLIRQVIELRLGRLDAETRRLLQIAALIGPDVSFDHWSAVSGADDAALERAVEQALRVALLAETPTGGLRFSHALIREALYASVIPTRRRLWHQQAAEALTANQTPDPDVVAHHFHQAGDARAAGWLVQAGERAERLYAWQVAINRYDAALEHFETDNQQRRTCADLLVRMAYLDRYASPERAISYAEQAAQIADEIGDEQLAMMSILSRGHLRVYLGDVRQGLDEMGRALERIDADHGFDDRTSREITATHLGREGRWGTYIQMLV